MKKPVGVPVLDYRIVLLGGCHSYGMLMTNSSMAQTTASLTHLVKMSEPFFTTIIMAVMGRLQFNCKIILIMIIILITAIGSEPISEAHSSTVGIFFALISNLCYALRNTGTKYFFSEDSSKSATTLDGFAALSVGGLLSLLPLWVFSYSLVYDNYFPLLSDKNSDLRFFLFISSISHALYNIISLTIILLFFNPVQHAMLNVGKRTSIVLVFYIFSQRHFTALNFVSAVCCLIISVVSVQALSVKKQSGTSDKSEDTISHKHLGLSIFILCLSLGSLSWVVTRHKATTNTDIWQLPIQDIWQGPISNAKQNWLQCIDDIQESIMRRLSDVLTNHEILNHPSPLLLIDPAYGGNVGDNLIAYGEVVLMERMGYLNHTECNVIQSQGLSKSCANYTDVADGGLAWWHGGGNWGDLWSREGLTLKRMRSFIQLAKKGKTVMGMPQSFHYVNKKYEAEDATEWMKTIAAEYKEEQSKTKMILTWRQNDSYEIASSLYPLVDNRLVLDSDQETMGLSFDMVDWWDRGRFFNKTSDQPGPDFKYKVLDEMKFNYQHMFKSSISM